MKKIMLIIMLGILLVLPIISAAEIDNWKSFDNEVGDYGKITIYNWNFIGKIFDIKLIELELKENTPSCSTNCYAEKEITLYKEGVLIDDVRFIEHKLGEEFETSIKDYNFYIQDGEKDVDDYGWAVVGKYVNGTDKYEYKKVGSHKEPNWIIYNEKEVLPPGSYNIRLQGSKHYSQTIDWQIKSQGRWIDNWAIWGGERVFQNNETADAYGYVAATNWWGQVFLSPEVLNITKVSLNLSENGTSTADMTVGIRAVNGSNFPSELGDLVNVTVSTTTLSEGWNNFSLPGFITAANTNYSIVVRCPLCGTGEQMFEWAYNTSSAYPAPMYYSGSSGEANWFKDAPDFPDGQLRAKGGGSALFRVFSTRSSVNLNSPPNDNISTVTSVQFSCTAITSEASLINISLFNNKTGTFERDQTNTTISPITNTTIFTSTFPDGTYVWNCEGCDDDGDCGLSSANRTIINAYI